MTESGSVSEFRIPVGSRLLGFVAYCPAGPGIHPVAGSVPAGLVAGLHLFAVGLAAPAPQLVSLEIRTGG